VSPRGQLIGGIAAHIGNKDQGQYLWPAHPVLFVNIGGFIQLGELVIPENVTVVGLSEFTLPWEGRTFERPGRE
jgi:hypothetical protein